MKYVITIKEVHTYDTTVEADSPSAALEIASDNLAMGQIDEAFGELEYSHTLDPEFWNVNAEVA